MSTFQKNFVVKNGLEVGILGGNTLFASGGKVGVGSTTPFRTFDVTGSVGISEDIYVQKTSYTADVVANNNLSVSGLSTFVGNVQLRGNLEVQGTQFIVNTEEVRVEDKNITLGFSTQIPPSDFYASGGGFELAGSVDTSILSGIGTTNTYKSFVWYDKTHPLFVSNQRVGIGTSTATNAAFLDVGGKVQFIRNDGWDVRVAGRSKFTGFTEIDNLSFTGIASLSQISVGSTLGTAFQYIRKNSGNTQLEWASFPDLRTVETFTATAGQTEFITANPYNIGFIDVYLNGVRLSSNEFVATNGTSVTLNAAAFLNDNVEIIIYAPEAGGVSSTVILEELSWKPTEEPNGIYTSGAVSIGTSESYGKFTVIGSGRFSGPVSIGTTAFFPTTDLLVNDDAGHPNIWLTAGPDVAGDDFRIGLTLADDGHAYLSTNDNIDLNFAVGGGVTSHVVIKEDGRVGIGSTLPSGKLDVDGTVNATAFVGDGSGLVGVIAASGGINLLDHGVSAGLAATVNIGGNLAITPASSGVATIFYNDVSSQWITVSAGLQTSTNVGIGTTNPTSKLTVSGDVLITGIATFGSSSVTIDGNNNLINVGTGVTINGSVGIISATEFYANGIPLSKAKVVISDTPPSSPESGSLWFSSLAGRGFIWYVDGDSSQWIDFSPTPGLFDLPWIQENDLIYSIFNVGIGSTTPTSKLDVVGDAKFTGVVTATSFNGDLNGNATTAGYATTAGISTVSQGLTGTPNITVGSVTANSVNSSGIVTASSFVSSGGFVKAADGTNAFYMYGGTGNVAFQGTIGASKINNASGYLAIDFAPTATPTVLIPNSLNVTGITTSTGGFVGNLTGNSTGLTGTPNINVGVTTASSLTVSNTSRFIGTSYFEGAVYEPVVNDFTTNIPITAGVFDIDASQSNVVVGVATTSVIKWNFVNVDPANSKSITITVILDSDSSYTYGDACDVNGSTIINGIQWGGGLPPVATNNTDILTFSLVRDGSGTIKVFGFGSGNFN